ncbi:hypothetical protein CEP54_011452 [Fusarium duplospermum]|uniref:Uncharacterized protein n=1 Tax=Fusarium duplospermum TaxID=1325734 RepID=A0A428PE68_9HYPO|nr:hypothetical protein CEP54_011452 [Fusarium duplospermum]
MTGGHSSLKTPAYHPTPQIDDAGYESSDSNPQRENSGHIENQRCKTLSAEGWGLEILSSFGSLILLGGIIFIFCYMKDRPLSDWQFPISLNAIISILTTACSAAIMHSVSTSISQLKWLHFATSHRKLFSLESFDEASRGPYGSIKFLFAMRWNLATIGALVTIFRLGLAPLAQQVVSLEARDVVTPDDGATFGYAYAYDRNKSLIHAALPPDPGMQSAILRGLYNFSSQPEFTCGGSCRWNGSYISLGFKSVCTNVTAYTLKHQRCDRYVPGPRSCNLTTPAGVNLSTWYGPTEGHTTFQINTTAGDYNVKPNASYRDMEVAKMAVYRATADLLYFNSSGVNITDCTLHLAAYEYSNAQANGSSFSFERIRQVDLSDGDHGECVGGGRGLMDCWMWQVMSNGSILENSPTLSVSELEMKALGHFFLSTTFKSQWIEGYGDNPNPGLSTVLGGDVDLSRAFQEMAMSMTDYVRNGPNRMWATGDRVQSEIFVSIRWHWLIGPIAIELAGLILTILTIVSNRRNVPLWKSSALAVLACQHDAENNLIQSKVRDMEEIIKVAENSNVRLE